MTDKELPQSALTPYITNARIDIPKDAWTQLNTQYSKDAIIHALSQEITSGHIQLPMRPLALADAEESFRNLCTYTCNDFVYDSTFTRYEYARPLSDKYLDESTVGNVSSDYFQQANRYACDSINSPSPVRTWQTPKFAESMLGALWTLKCDHVDTAILRQLLSLRKYIASQFKPAVAKSIYEKFNARDVLDFSAGWGDRLAGFYACKDTRSYIGIDPNTAVYNQYSLQSSTYDNWIECTGITEKCAEFINMPAEEVDLDTCCVDTVFTSPPYFNIERYSREPTQSVWRYRKLADWLSKFLFASIDTAWDALKSGGYMILNVSDVYSNHTVNHICDPMCDHIDELGGKFVECFGMAMSKRPNSGALKGKTGKFVEPVWVYKKD